MEPSQKQAGDDGRVCSLPKPAVNLAQRLTQLANSEATVTARVVIIGGEWLLFVERPERMGKQGVLGAIDNQ